MMKWHPQVFPAHQFSCQPNNPQLFPTPDLECSYPLGALLLVYSYSLGAIGNR